MLLGRLAWETADILQQHHFDIWGMTTEIPYWWCITTQIWVGMRHLYETSAIVPRTSGHGQTSGGIATRSTVFSEQKKYDLCHGRSGNDVAAFILTIIIIPQAWMGSESIAHEAKGQITV